MPVRDFLQEVPELARLKNEPLLQKALERGDALALHEGLRRWRKQHPTQPEPWVDTLLANRRFFLTPAKPPPMRTLNGVGTSLHGSNDVDAKDGTYISTLFLVVLFIPLFPIAQYLVARGTGRSWRFFGKVPLSDAHRTWRKTLGLAFLVVALAGAAAFALLVYQAAQSTRVQVLNGLSLPVRVRVDRDSLVVPAQGNAELKVRPGRHHFVAEKTSGELLEQRTETVPRWKDLVVFNVLGVAPAYLETVTYSADGNVPGQTRPLAGESFAVEDDVPYVLTDPPEHMQVESGGSTSVQAFAVSRGGWEATTRLLISHDRIADAAQVAEAVLLADTDNATARSLAVELAHRAGGNEALLALANRWIHHDPEDAGAQFLYVDALRGLGRGPEALAFAQERLNALPDSTQFAELVARAEDPDAALRRYEALVRQLPGGNAADAAGVTLHRGLAIRELFAHHGPEALTQFAWMQSHDPHYGQLLVAHARALLLIDRPDWACTLLEAWAPKGSPPRWDASLLHAQLRTRYPKVGTQPAGFLTSRLVSEAKLRPREWVEATLAVMTGAPNAAELLHGDRIPRDKASMLELRLALNTNRADALKQAARAPERVLAQLDDAALLKLALMARQAGNDDLAKRLDDANSDTRVDPRAAFRYVQDGEEPARLLEWPLETQGVLRRARAEVLKTKDPTAAQALLHEADAGLLPLEVP